MTVCESGCRIVAVFLFLLLPLFARTEPDTLRLVTHVQSFKGRKQIPATEYKVIRNQWIAWIDRRLLQGGTVESMNRELEEARLIAPELAVADQFENGQLGMVEPLTLLGDGSAPDLMLVDWTMHRGICLIDTNVLIYQRTISRHPARIGAYEDSAYLLQDIAVGPIDASGNRLIATGWTASNCASNWNGKAMRIDRVRGGIQKNILTRSFSAYSAGGKDVEAEIKDDVVTFRYQGAVHDGDLLSGPAVSSFRIDGDFATREAPFALTLAGVLNEWICADRQEAA